LKNQLYEGKQMTVIAKLTGASSASISFEAIDWQKAVIEVRRLQMRIAKAYRERKHGRVKALQWLLTHSFYAKLLAVKRVVQNKGARTPGVDGVIWKTSDQKIKAAQTLRRCDYQTKPLKRIYIPKKQKGKLRPLSIPVMECRAQQALHLLSLEPIAELKADINSYGFRPLRSCADAIEQCFKTLSHKKSAAYVLEGDIRACFDNISHSWMLDNIPMDKEILRKWLRAGYIEQGTFHSTYQGTPQGGIISPTLLNLTLSGMEATIHAATRRADNINVIIYADDFIITGATKEVLENKVKPLIETFLGERGLSLSQEKTKITHIDEGFDFLGMNIRKYSGKLLIRPANSSIKRFLVDIRETVKRNATVKTEILIQQLNSKIQGWVNYYRHVCSSDTFNYVEKFIFQAVWQWAKRRHPDKTLRQIKDRYFRSDNTKKWIFSAKIKDKHGDMQNLDLISLNRVPIKRHVKIRAEANPYDPAYHEYLSKRISVNENIKKSSKRSMWWLRWWELL
jgi:RNA-directed DNA polymerase